MTARSSKPLAIIAVGACLSLAACGSSEEEPKGKPLPRAAAAALEKRLDEVERRYRDAVENQNVGACNDIEKNSFAAADGIDAILAGLPADVDPDVRSAAADSFENLRTLTEEGCSNVKPAPEPEPEPEPEPVPEPEPIPEETVPTETIPEEPELEGTVPEELVPPKKGNGGGVPPGQGGQLKGKDKGNNGGAVAPPGEDG